MEPSTGASPAFPVSATRLTRLPSSAAYADTLHAAHKLYMAPICFQFWGANANRYYEYSGYQGMRALWMQAIQTTHPDWVEIITWNDFIEGTYVSPIDDPARYPGANDLGASIAPADTQHFFHSHRGATDLLAYFIAWYKTGHQPALHNDSIYWAYRTVLSTEHQPPIKLYGPIADALYITANLTAPADLTVTLGPTEMTITLPAGSNDLQLPLSPGPAPHFALTRNHGVLTQATADDPVLATAPLSRTCITPPDQRTIRARQTLFPCSREIILQRRIRNPRCLSRKSRWKFY